MILTCSIFFLSISEKKKRVFLFVAVKKNARFQKMQFTSFSIRLGCQNRKSLIVLPSELKFLSQSLLAICYKNPHDVESAKSKLCFYTRKSTKNCPLRSPAARPTNLTLPVRWPSAAAHPQLNQFHNQNLKKSKFKNVMLPEKKHPYPSFYCDSMKEERKNEFLAFFQAQKSNVSCTNSSVVMEWNVPLLSSFILSCKKWRLKFPLSFFACLEKCPMTPLSITLLKNVGLCFLHSVLRSKLMAAKFSPLFLRLSWKMPDDSSLSHTLEKMAAFAFFIQSFQQKNGGKISPLFLRFV